MTLRILKSYILLKNFIDRRPSLLKIVENLAWLSFDKILKFTINIFVIALVAQYLGPKLYGLWNYAIAFASIFGVFATLGLDSIVVRELVKYPNKTDELLSTTFFLRLFGATLSFILCIVAAFILKNNDALTFSLIALSSAGSLIQVFSTVDYYFQSKIMSKYTVWAQNIAFIIMSSVRILLVLVKAPLVSFALAALVEGIIANVLLVIFFFKKYSFPLKKIQFNLSLAKYLLKESWPLLLSGIAIIIYLRIDQIMIKEMLGNKEVGIYSAAVRISELCYVLPMMIATTIYPKIIEYKKSSEELYYKKLQDLFLYITWFGILVGLILTIFAGFIVKIIFGKEFILSASVLKIHGWSGIFVCLGVASSGWYMAENLSKMAFYRTLLGALSNIILNFILIPKFSIYGAAISTLISYAIAGYFFDLLSRKTKIVFIMKSKVFFPIYIFKLKE
ncbi:MAG: flippase [Bacteroidales bacterium]|nr:flippase [Bacteroidales bacterium]